MKGSWKTTLAGILGGLLVTFGPAVGGRLQCQTSTAPCEAPPITSGNYLPGIAVAILGALTKDKDVTGGTRPQ